MSQPILAARKQRLALRVAIAAVLVSSTLAVPALGADAEKVAARAHYDAATRLYDIHDYGEALKEYRAAYLAKPDPVFLFNIGQCYKKLGQNDQALQFFRDYLRKAPADDPNREQVQARIRETEAALSQGTPSTTPATTALPTSAGEPGQAPTLNVPPQANQPAGLDLTSPVTTQPEGAQSHFYGTWWFWTGVGAVVIAGTVTAIALSRGTNGPNISGMTLGTQTVLR